MEREKSIRRQASLYLCGVPEIEEIRWTFNPAQARLIPPHVTLCREDEVDDWQALAGRINELLPLEITLEFGRPIREENLVMLPAVGGLEAFDKLRCRLLGETPTRPRKHLPHLTLIHPRNGICTDTIFAELAARLQSFTWTFRAISLIEQMDGGPWVRFAHLGAPE